MLARRLLIALAVLMVLTALAAGVAPRERSSPGDDQAAAPAASASPAPKPVEQVLDAQAEGQQVRAEVGQMVRITVRSDELATVSLENIGVKTADVDSPAIFELLADVPGSYGIDLIDPDRRIGTLEIGG